MRSSRLALAILVALLLFSCGPGNTSNYAGAARAAAFGIGAAAVARAANGSCWGNCVMGTVCNHDTGFCEQAPEPDKQPTAPTVVSAPAASASATPEPVPLPAPTPVCSPPCGLDERCVPGARRENVCEPNGTR